MLNTLLAILIVCAVAGLLIYLLDMLPIDPTIKIIGKVIMIIVALIYIAKTYIPGLAI